MVEERLDDLRTVRQLLAGGDVLSPRHVRMVLENLPNCRLINGYGPTENTTFTCCHVMGYGERIPDPVPIGRPISNTRVYILDEQLRLTPTGSVGELYAAGDGLARGYLNNSEATAQKFLPDPFAADRDDRMYRTGDLARWRDDGVVEFLGRADNQVKILGHRIEPGEIETVLGTHGRIKQSCVVPNTDENGSKRLVAYYVPAGSEVKAAELRAFLTERLPQYMIPALLVPVSALPLTPNGKIDRAAFPAPCAAVQPQSAVETATTQLERTIVGIWSQQLGSEQVRLDDNFFDLGGNSLSLVRIHMSLRKALQVEIPMTVLFEFTTVRSLARYFSGQVSAEPSFSEAQQRARKQRAAFARQRERKVGSTS
jgi:non-ribosomal peptide synthetase component F